jgi:type II secretory pathway pseudopilin PulG
MQTCSTSRPASLLRKRSSSVKSRRIGFTIPELIATIGIIVTLAALGAGAYRANISRFEAPRCMANLRTLHIALSAHIQDRQQWPQLPEDLAGINTPQEYDWWTEKLLPYGMLKESWVCPTLRRLVKSKEGVEAPKIHYMPSIFDEHALTPFKWPSMPWAMEVADIHGAGILRLYSDGSIRPFTAFRDQSQVPAVKVAK